MLVPHNARAGHNPAGVHKVPRVEDKHHDILTFFVVLINEQSSDRGNPEKNIIDFLTAVAAQTKVAARNTRTWFLFLRTLLCLKVATLRTIYGQKWQ